MLSRGVLAVVGVAVVAVAMLAIWSGRPSAPPPRVGTTTAVIPVGAPTAPSTTATGGDAPAPVPIGPPPDTPGRRPMTVYAVRNLNSTAITVEHVITDTAGFRYVFTSTVGPGETAEYHLRDIVAVPSPFDGALKLNAALPFTATVVGYD